MDLPLLTIMWVINSYLGVLDFGFLSQCVYLIASILSI